MDEPPTSETIRVSESCRRQLAELETDGGGTEVRLLIASMIRCLEAAAGRHVLYVYAVPYLVAAAELLASPRAATTVAIRGCRYDIDTLVPPVAPRDVAPRPPDVLLSALSRGAKRDTPD